MPRKATASAKHGKAEQSPCGVNVLETIARAQLCQLKDHHPEMWDALQQSMASYHNKEYVVGTLFSGFEFAVLALQNFFKVFGDMSGIQVCLKHVLAAEICPKKREFIKNMHPELLHLLCDVADFSRRKLQTHGGGSISLEELLQEKIDHLIAGFVCKDISPCNGNRKNFAATLNKEDGRTGSTYKYMKTAILKIQPRRVLVENVASLFHHIADAHGNKQPPQIGIVLRDLHKLMGASAAAKSNAKRYGILCSRERAYMCATSGVPEDRYRELFSEVLAALQLPQPAVKLSVLFAASPEWPVHVLSKDDRQKIKEASLTPRGVKAAAAGADGFFGLQNSRSRPEASLDLVPCLRPNSKIYSSLLKRILQGRHHLALQGMTAAEAPMLAGLTISESFCKDGAGNGMACHQLMANFAASLVAEVLAKKAGGRRQRQPLQNKGTAKVLKKRTLKHPGQKQRRVKRINSSSFKPPQKPQKSKSHAQPKKTKKELTAKRQQKELGKEPKNRRT